MLRSLSLTLLTLSLALPGASSALGLGDIHVSSALHQRLVAQIDLVGATQDELPKLSGGIANEEIFQRYGLERPAFLTGTTLVVGQDKQGRPTLTLHSAEPFTEPVVTFLVDLHSPGGELIREYTVLLDPPGLVGEPTSGGEAALVGNDVAAGGISTQVGLAAPGGLAAPVGGATSVGATAPAAPPVTSTREAAPTAPATGKTYRVASRDTLDRIVGIAGARSRSDRHRMMVAIFRANPSAFRANLNLLRVGATLHIPTTQELSATSAEDAKREYDAQMAAWRSPEHHAPAIHSPAIAKSEPTPAASVPGSVSAPQPNIEPKPDVAPEETDNVVLTQRIETLEKSLAKLRRELSQPPVVAHAQPASDTTASDAEVSEEDDSPPPPPFYRTRTALLVVSLVAMLAAAAWLIRRLRSLDSTPAQPRREHEFRPTRKSQQTEQTESLEFNVAAQPFLEAALPPASSPPVATTHSETKAAGPKNPSGESNWFKDSFSTPIGDLLANELTAKLEELPPQPASSADGAGDTWATDVLSPTVEIKGNTAEQKFSFYNPESTNTTHVVLDSGLKEPPPFVERRKNPADVLRQAIEREPDRSDLRLKLLELYYTAAEQNRRAFVEATHQLAKNDKLASAEDWSRIADMGRTIAPEDELFQEPPKDKAVA